jgi:NADH-quinone oxidoreductase subunit M
MTDLLQLPLLSITTFLPIVGVLLILLLPKGQDNAARLVALLTSLAAFAVSLVVLYHFDPANTGFQFVQETKWMSFGKVTILNKMGVDGLSIWFVVASAFLMPICILASWDSIKDKVREFMIALLVLQTMMTGMFCALDFVLFYLFFEGVLLPMFLIVGVWGGPGRVHASYKFFLYTLLGSVVMLLAVIAMCLFVGTTDMTVMLKTDFPPEWQNWLWLAFFCSFAVKTPMWPVHTWLPYAHVEAPTTGSVILAGILLKMGGYGFIRISLQMLPQASDTFQIFMFVLSGIAIVATSLTALVQTDMKRLIAYSSVAHMGFVTMATFTKTVQGLEGAVMVMLSHTLVSSALFLCVGVLYDRLHSRDIARYGGVVNNMPHFALYAMLFTLASVGMPGTSGFVGEFLAMQGAYVASTWMAAVAGLGVILGAAYMLWLYRRVFFGPLVKEDVAGMTDLTVKEYVAFVPLAVLVLVMGIQPHLFKDVISPTMKAIVETTKARTAAVPPPVVDPVPDEASAEKPHDKVNGKENGKAKQQP